MMAAEIIVRACALSAAAFAPFGDVIEIEGRDSRWINDDTCRRFDDLALEISMCRGSQPVGCSRLV